MYALQARLRSHQRRHSRCQCGTQRNTQSATPMHEPASAVARRGTHGPDQSGRGYAAALCVCAVNSEQRSMPHCRAVNSEQRHEPAQQQLRSRMLLLRRLRGQQQSTAISRSPQG